jgi:hypothetical protein
MERRAFLFGAAAALSSSAALAQYQPQGRELVRRLQALQADDGAILMPGKGTERDCNPYFANLAVIGLLIGTPPSTRGDAARVARSWIAWYATHINANGTMDDHRGTPGALKPTGKADSTDSYAATFQTVVWAYLARTGDQRTVAGIEEKLAKIAKAALLTMQPSGLTNSRPDYPVAYLMDNVEVWQGLDSWVRTAGLLGRKDEAAEARKQADALLATIDEKLWLPQEGNYAWAMHPSGKREGGLEKWYPAQMANLMAMAVLPLNDRRSDLFVRMDRRFQPLPVKIEDVGSLEKALWWALAALRRGDNDQVERYQLLLAKFPWDANRELNPALLGHALHVGSGHVGPED